MHRSALTQLGRSHFVIVTFHRPPPGRGVGGSSRLGGFGRVAANEIQRRVVGLAGLYEGVISVLGQISALAPKQQCENELRLSAIASHT